MTKVRAFKLSTGEEIIAGIERRDGNGEIILNRPKAIGLVQTPNHEVAIQLIPFMASNQDGNITIFEDHVVAETEPTSELEKGYLSKTSGIQMVTG